ncbi:acyl-CoA thioesterase [Sphingorhabdus sp. SMR4y]|uniref:acyl-CoA thioesterase n=1 Tax=Sphingorhabdus sp. SMR4y TaxID=2584094 RepID=UPI000B5C25E7|nr:thioesterase family protein [Sphingorhabdus sp. SMR4y]ASK87712.1 thioesterase-like superfamily protein [Sphingorhabdus sp. SMR4y]
MTYIFDQETTLVALEDGLFSVPASDVYRNPTGMAFGGWVAAIAGRAVTMHPECRGPLVSQQIIFMTGVGPGEVRLAVRLLRAGSSTQFWRVELSQNGSLTNAADIVTSTRRPTDIDYQVEMPAAKLPEDSLSLPSVNPMAPEWVVHYDQRIAKGIPFAVNDSPEGIVWIRETDGRPVDRISLLSILDTPMPRTFFVTNQFRPGSSVTMASYIYASEEDLAEAGSDHMLLRVTGATVRNSATDGRVEIWSKSGILLATSSQIGFFR